MSASQAALGVATEITRPPSPTVLTAKMPNFVDDTLPKEMLDSMEQLRRNEELCDVELVVDQRCFRAHRVVLAASSTRLTHKIRLHLFAGDQ